LMGEGHLRDLDADVRVILRWILRKEFVSVWTGFKWLKIGLNSRSLWTRWSTFGFRKNWRMSWIDGWLSVSRKLLFRRVSRFLVSSRVFPWTFQ
jgi:hypothetical protein